jgi:alkanesulfonate monooxygenase
MGEINSSRQTLIAEMAKKNNYTIRQTWQAIAGGRGHFDVHGSPQDIADVMEQWIREDAADGFNIMPPVMPGGLEDFVELVIPELQKRGLFRRAYEGTTLRENLGLKRPASRHAKEA